MTEFKIKSVCFRLLGLGWNGFLLSGSNSAMLRLGNGTFLRLNYLIFRVLNLLNSTFQHRRIMLNFGHH